VNKPLEGIKVVELAMWAFVPSAGAVLSDMGAQVIRSNRLPAIPSAA
jgi:crotonobetainyl-CoA:carnitine CoA-transferase CaiB-like acyl-CoA transferase